MKHKFLLFYTWFIRISLFAFPDIPCVMRFRGRMYSLGMKSSGKNFQVCHNVIITSLENLTVGNNVYIAMGNILLASGDVHLDDDVMLGPNCLLTAGNHSYLNGSYRFGPAKLSPIYIGSGSWIGGHCILLPGLNFPKGSVAGAGSVLTNKLIDKGEGLYAGCPAKYIKSNK